MLKKLTCLSFIAANYAFATIELAPVYRNNPSPPPFQIMAPSTYAICWDIDMSPYAGGEDLLFGTRLIEKAEVYWIGKTPLPYSKSTYARTWRLSELFLVWLPLNYLAMVVQHEVFGHGYRIRDINNGRVEVNGYSFNGPPPYGPGGAATSYKVWGTLTTTQDAAIAIGGVEATAILAQLTKLKWLEAARIDPRQSVLYLFAQQDLNLYIGTLKVKDKDLSGHDIHGYLKALNQTYPDNILSKGRLRSLSWINIADPFTFYAIYSWFHYLSSGKETKIPMIGSIYLPGLRLGLTPFGPEVFFENYFLYKIFPIYGYFKGGHHAKNKYYGIGVYAPRLYAIGRWSFGLRIDLWRQPKLLLNPGAVPFFAIDFYEKPSVEDPLYPSSLRHAVRYGGAGSALIWFKAAEWCGFESEFGYKAQGFLPGYSLTASPTVRLAYTVTF